VLLNLLIIADSCRGVTCEFHGVCVIDNRGGSQCVCPTDKSCNNQQVRGVCECECVCVCVVHGRQMMCHVGIVLGAIITNLFTYVN